MMRIHPKVRFCAYVSIALIFTSFQSASAGTIIKLDLGSDPPADVQYSGGVFSTASDGDATTVGDQDTAVQFADFLSYLADIPSGASYTLSGVTRTGAPVNVFGSVAQAFTGGSFQLYDNTNTLLLSAALTDSSLFGTAGAPATGAVFSTNFGSVLGGTLAPQIQPNSISMSISLTNVKSANGSPGLTTTQTPGGLVLNPFTADASKLIAGDPTGGGVPEPAAAVLIGTGVVMMRALSRRRS